MRVRRALPLVLPAALAAGCALVLHRADPADVERIYSRGLYPAIARGMGRASDLVSFSLAEVWAVLLIGVALFLLSRSVVRLIRGRASLRRGASFLVRLVLLGVPAVYLLFVGLWGANYRRLPVEAKTGYAETRLTPERLRETLLRLALSTSHERPAGEASLSETTLSSVADALDEVVDRLEGRPVPCARRPKTLLLNGFFRLAGIHGITVPFTHEAHHRRDLLPCEIPFIVAHERAHLAGYGSEAEASFVGYAACVRSEDPLARYSGRLAAFLHFLAAAPKADREAAVAALSEGVKEDIRAIRKRRAEEASALHDVSRGLNDAYLRANRIEGGVEDYGRVVRLLLGAGPGWAP